MGYTGEEIRRHIDEYARLTALAEEIARRIDDEKAYFTKLAERDLSDSEAICSFVSQLVAGEVVRR